MKRIGFLLLILCVFFVGLAGAQQPATSPLMPATTASQNAMVRGNHHDAVKTWELGTYPGGTWFTTQSINDLGVVVGLGDVPPIGPDGVGYTHPLAVHVFGPHAGEWIDLGTLGGEQPRGFEYESQSQISNTGLVASHSSARDGYVHGVAWTKKTGMVDLGTLADAGDPQYASHNSSLALATNKLGTLIVGWSGIDGVPQAPVVWTPSTAWKHGKLVTTWKIHKLDTITKATFGEAWWVTDFGQISGVCGNQVDFVTGVVWNPRSDGKGWQLTILPLDSDYPNSNAYGINERGEITGVAISEDGSIWLPRLWKPLDRRRTAYSQPIELALPDVFTSCESVGINDLGDIVGDCWTEDYSVDLPVRWITQDPAFSEIIELPGSWGYSWGVNNSRIAALTYGDGENCSADSYVTCGGATELPER